uniref:Uncharacterized protein n=1 Tax=Anguilla anguilla TaxID=7936 RepID=A0A0E9QCM4_ANGAN
MKKVASYGVDNNSSASVIGKCTHFIIPCREVEQIGSAFNKLQRSLGTL